MLLFRSPVGAFNGLDISTRERWRYSRWEQGSDGSSIEAHQMSRGTLISTLFGVANIRPIQNLQGSVKLCRSLPMTFLEPFDDDRSAETFKLLLRNVETRAK